MLQRVLEPEVMDDPDEARAYDEMDHGEVNRCFVADMLAAGVLDKLDDPVVLDLGTGTAQIPIELCRQHTTCRIVASDAAQSMLEVARINVAVEGFEHRIQLHLGDGKRLEFFDELFAAVISNSLLHHLAEPQLAFREMLRVLQPGGWLFLRDLLRPSSTDEVERLVQTYAAGEPLTSQQLLRQSLFAALDLQEVRQLASDAGFAPDCVAATTDRHWTLAVRKPAAAG